MSPYVNKMTRLNFQSVIKGQKNYQHTEIWIRKFQEVWKVKVVQTLEGPGVLQGTGGLESPRYIRSLEGPEDSGGLEGLGSTERPECLKGLKVVEGLDIYSLQI